MVITLLLRSEENAEAEEDISGDANQQKNSV